MTTHTTAADEAAIRTVLTQIVTYWNQADGTGYGTLFTEDADYVDVTGNRTCGGDAIGSLHQFLFDGPLKGSILEGYQGNPYIQFLAPEVALVVSGGTSRLDGHTTAPDDRQSVNTTVLVKRDGEWRIRAFQNNRVQSFGPPPAVRS